MADDLESWTKIAEGNAAAFDAFYLENRSRLCAFLRQLVGSHQAAEDLAQETFAQIWNRPNWILVRSGERCGDIYTESAGSVPRSGGEAIKPLSLPT